MRKWLSTQNKVCKKHAKIKPVGEYNVNERTINESTCVWSDAVGLLAKYVQYLFTWVYYIFIMTPDRVRTLMYPEIITRHSVNYFFEQYVTIVLYEKIHYLR